MAARHVRLFVLLLGSVWLGSACATAAPTLAPGATSPAATTAAGPGETTSPGATSLGELPPEFQHVFEIPADPIAVQPTLDVARQVEKVIPAEGGQIAATAADGTTFVLDVPADALAAEKTIRLTPVSAIAAMPFGSDPHAVQLEPEGLQFLDYVTLTITPITEIPIDQQILFAYQGTGENLTLALPAGNSAPIAIRLLHFSGAGVTRGTAAQVAHAQPRIGATAEARITSAIAAELGRARNAVLLGLEFEAADLGAILGLLRQYELEVVNPRIAAAGTSCAAGTLAIQTALGHARQAALLGVQDDAAPAVEVALVTLVADVCVREEYERCRDQHVIQNMIPTWLGWSRQSLLLGLPEGDASLEHLADYARKCLAFEMRFESQAELTSAGAGWNSAVRSTVELRFDPSILRFDFAQAELVNFSFTFKAGGGCNVTSIPGGGTFNAIAFMFLRDTRTPTDEVGYVRDLEFGYNPGATTESVKLRCQGISTTIPSAGFWSGSFINLHRGEGGVHDGSYMFVASDWEILGDAYYARKEWIKTGDHVVEAGTLKLYHTPE